MVALLTDHPKGMKSKEIAELLNVGLPKIAEAISLNESLFEKREKGPKSVIQLTDVTGHFKMYHPRSNQNVPPRDVGFLDLAGYPWQGLRGFF
jgi:hypothetical protein